KVVCIPNSIPEVQDSLPEKSKTILHVGRLNIHQKRSDLLLDVWARVHAALPDWQFIIVGDGEYKETIDRQILSRALPRVQTVGYQNPTNFYRQSSLFVMTSAFEGFPNVIIEAQSFGVIPFAFNSFSSLG